MSEPNYHCPLCHTLARLVINTEQAVCSNDNCPVITFNPSLPDGGMSQANEVDLSAFDEWVEEPAMIHALHQGLPLCGFSARVPAEWPQGHQWVHLKDWQAATCAACRAEASRRQTTKSKET